jgi:putative ABC transport system permease protein
MGRILSTFVERERFSMLLLTLFAVIALVLASVGIYGVTSYSISQRTAEMGIRMAVGADPSDVVSLVLALVASVATYVPAMRAVRIDPQGEGQ